MLPGTAVEFGDKLAAGGDHDRVEPRRPIENPSAEPLLDRGCHVANMNTAVIKVEVECLRSAFAEGQRCRGFGGVNKPMQLSQTESAVALSDVTEDTAGTKRGELLTITK